jgi:N utilization substance protein B
MSLPQKKFREAVFCAVYSQDFSAHPDREQEIPLLMELLAMSKKNTKEALQRASLILEKKESIDEKIKQSVPDYELNRIGSVERNILRLATYELLFDTAVPGVVVISEGIRLCRKFSTPEAAHFVNGVLDTIYKQHMQIASHADDGH